MMSISAKCRSPRQPAHRNELRGAPDSELRERSPREALLRLVCTFVLGSTFLLLSAGPLRAANWYDSNWTYRKKISIDSTDVPGTVTNFPVLVSITDTDLRDDAQNDGDDLLFTSDNGTTKLDHEIEAFDGATGLLLVWVKVPTVSSSTDTDIFLYYGYASATNQENITGVWSNGYEAVYHLHDDFLDSTSNSRDGTNNGSVDSAALIGDGQDFIPVDDIDLGTWSTSAVAGLTLQSWARYDDFDQNDPRILAKAQDPANTNDHVYMLGLGGTDEKHLRFRVKTGTDDASGSTELLATSSPAVVTTWHLIAGTYDGSNMRLYKDGTQVASTSKTGNVRQNSWDVVIGNHPGNTTTGNRCMDGKFDEVRISSVGRSSDWLTTEYNNQFSPSGFYTVGSEEIEETVWSGAVDTDWFDGANWSGGVPNSGCDARIPGSLTNYPLLDATGAATRDLTIASGGSVSVSTFTLTVSGTLDNNGTTTIGTGAIDVSGTFDATGGSVTFTGAGRLQLAGAVTSLGTLTESTGTIEYDRTAANQTVLTETYYNLEIDNSTRVALSGGNLRVLNNLTVTSGELEIDDGDELRVDGDVSVTGVLDIEPASLLQLSASSTLTVNSGGIFEAIGTWDDLTLVTSSDESTPGRYTFTVSAGGLIDVDWGYFRFMDSNGIQITDNGAVTALRTLDNTIFDNGASGGRLLRVTNNDNAVTLSNLQFFDTNSNLTYNVETVSATATLTIDPYDNNANTTSFGGPSNENDNGGGTVTPGFVLWGATTPVRLRNFDVSRVTGGVLLEWETLAEWQVAGFSLERRIGSSGFHPVGPPLLASQAVPPSGAMYRWLDDFVRPGIAETYRLSEVGQSGSARVIAERTLSPTALLLPLGGSAPVGRLSMQPKGTGRVRLSTSTPASQPPQASALSSSVMTQAIPGVVKILVNERGMTRVSSDLLAGAGFDPGGDSTRWRLRHGEVEIPLRTFRDRSGASFLEQHGFDFFAEPIEHLESRSDVYWLDIAAPLDPAPARIPTSGAMVTGVTSRTANSTTTIEAEKDLLYVASLADGAGRDHWFWELLVSPGTLEVPLLLDHVVVQDASNELELWLEAWNQDPLEPLDHSVVVRLNGVDLGTVDKNGSGPIGGSFSIPPGVLSDGSNVIEIEAVDIGLPSVLFLDRLELRFSREHFARSNRLEFGLNGPGPHKIEGFDRPEINLYRTSGPAGLAWIDAPTYPPASFGPLTPSLGRRSFEQTFMVGVGGGGRFEAFTEAGARTPVAVLPRTTQPIIAPLVSVDLIVITPARWALELDPLVSFRRSQGWSVEVVELEAIFDEFGGGRETTDAIREFLSQAWFEWPAPAPSAVLLVGDATYDPSGNLGHSSLQVLPTRLIETPYLEAASDHWFGDVEGMDGISELVVGRFPVSTREECRGVVEKIVDHETRGILVSGLSVFASDDEADFLGLSAMVAARLPAGTPSSFIEIGTQPIADLQTALRQDWRAGAETVHYTGHGSRLSWASEEILTVPDVATLVGPRLPVVTAMNCLNGYFLHRETPSLGEALLLEPDAGAVAYWGPTAITSHLAQQQLALEFYERLYSAPGVTLGEAIRTAEKALAGTQQTSKESWRTHLETWILFGDPMTRVRY